MRVVVRFATSDRFGRPAAAPQRRPGARPATAWARRRRWGGGTQPVTMIAARPSVSHNLIEDNYNGVALWENADRFCGSAANTSSGYCTLVNPSVAKISTCTAANIAKQPYYSDCRWKTQNVLVEGNCESPVPGTT